MATRTSRRRTRQRKMRNILLAVAVTAGTFAAGNLYFTLATDSDPAVDAIAIAEGYQEAQRLNDAGERRAAMIELKNLLQQAPQHTASRSLLGRLLFEQQQWGAAEKELGLAIEQGAEAQPLLPMLIRSQIRQGKLALAQTTLESRWDEQTDAGGRVLLLGDIQLRAGKLDEANVSFQRALALSGDPQATMGLALVARARGLLHQALTTVEPIIDQPALAQQARLLKTELLLDLRRADEALPLVNGLLADQPEAEALKLLRARAYILLGQHQEARQDLSSLPEKYQQLPQYQILSGLAAMGLADYAGAYQAAEAALQQLPDNPRALLIAGSALYINRDYGKAVTYLSRFVEQAPQNINGRRLLAATQQNLKQPTAAIQTLQPLLDAPEVDARTLAIAGYAHLSLGEWDQGERLLTQALAQEPQLSKLRNQLALSQIMGGKSDVALQSMEDSGEQQFQTDTLRLIAYLQQQQFSTAHAFLQQRIDSAPEASAYRLLQGLVYLRQSNLSEARNSYSRALQIEADYPAALMGLARIDLMENKPKDAALRLQQLLRQDPDHLPALMTMALIEQQLNGDEAMLSWINTARHRQPEALQPVAALLRYYSNRGELDKARSEAHAFYLSRPDNSGATALYASTLRAAGELAEALKLANKLIEKHPRHPLYLQLLAEIHRDRRDYPQALGYSRQALELNPQQAANLYLHSDLLLRSGQAAEAQPYAEQLLAMQRNSASARLLGLIHLAQQQPHKALPLLQLAAEAGIDGGLVLALSSGYQQLGNNDQAIALLARFLEQAPKDLGVRFRLAGLYQVSQQHSEAIEHYEQLRELVPDNPIPWNNLAWLYQQRQDKRSLNYARQALRLAPQRGDIIDTLGWILLAEGEVDEAVKLLRQAAELLPDNEEIRFHLAEALVQSQQPLAARELLTGLASGNGPFQQPARLLLIKVGQLP